MNNLIDKVLCIDCHEHVTIQKTAAVCRGCQRKYKIYKGILIMLNKASLQDEHNLSQQDYYDKEYVNPYVNSDLEWRKRYIKRLIRFLPRNKKSYILDLACGQGYVTIAIAKLGYQVVACDISMKGLLQAKQEAERLGIDKNILFMACDVNEVSYAGNTFSFTILLHVLEHIVDDSLLMKRIINFSKSSAKYYIGVPLSFAYVFPLFVPLYKFSDHKVGHKRRYSIEQVKKLFGSKARVINIIYSGHLLKFVGAILSMLHIKSWEIEIEDYDEKLHEKKRFASNLTAVIEILK